MRVQWAYRSDTPLSTSYRDRGNNQLYISSKQEDPDEYDDSVLGHEIGHFLEHEFSHSDSPGGDHDGSPTDPRLAWSEGYGTFMGSAIFNDSRYIDTKSTGSSEKDLSVTFDPLPVDNSCLYAFNNTCDDGYFGADFDGFCLYGADTADCGQRYTIPYADQYLVKYSSGINQNISENIVASILWNLANGSSLHTATDNKPIFDVLSNYFVLNNFNLYDVGVIGVDLADFIKGFQCVQHPELTADLYTLVSLYHWPIDSIICE